MKTTKLRYPRHQGLTYLALTLKKTTNKEECIRLKERIINISIQIYVDNGMMVGSKLISIPDMAHYLEISTIELMRKMQRNMERIGNLLDGDEGRAITRVQIFQSLKTALENQALNRYQATTLLAQQGGKYVPFLTSEVNRSLANLTAAQKPIMDILKVLTDKGTMNLNFNDNRTSNQTLVLGVDQAVGLIQEKAKSILEDPAYLNQRNLELLNEVPEVRAAYQGDLSHIGLKVPKKAEDTTDIISDEMREIDTPNGTKVPKKKGTHTDRREGQFGTIILSDKEASEFLETSD